MLKLVKEILDGSSPILNITVLNVTAETIDKAKNFMMLSFKYKFGSHDAIIAATAITHSTMDNILYVVTSDRALRAAMKEEGVQFIVPGASNDKA